VRQSGAFLGFLKRVSTSEHGIAGHDRLALSVRSWSSCSIAAMRRLKSENLELSWRGLARGDSGPHAGAGNPFVGWVQPTANAVRPVGCTHPTAAPSSPCELRWTADRVLLAPLTVLSPGPRLAGVP